MVTDEHRILVKRDHAKPPQGGHRYTEGSMVLKGETVDEVLSKISKYRAENALPLGDPENDLGLFYKKIAPYLVRNAPPREQPQTEKQAEAIMRLWREHPEVLSGKEAVVELRRNRCAVCPLKRGFLSLLRTTDSYEAMAHRRAALLTENRDFDDTGLCSWTYLPVELVTLIKHPLQWSELPPVPKPCWVAKP